jgi:hypothetical protein
MSTNATPIERVLLKPKGNDSDGKKRHRSPSYPTVGLREALERTKKFYEMDGKAGAPPETAAKHIGFATAHGQAMSVLSALKKFGLIEDKHGRIVPTQRALELLNLPEHDPRRPEALRMAALAPPIYRKLLEKYREAGCLPHDDTLKGELVTYEDFNPNAVDAFIKDFRATLDFAGISDFSVIEYESEMHTEESEAPKTPIERVRLNPSPAPVQIRTPMVSRPTENMFIWPLSKGITAQVSFSGGAVKAAHLELLAKYLDLAKLALEAEEEEPE